MAEVHCPETKEIRPMSDCMKCALHIEDGTSLEWCRYREAEIPRKEVPLNALRLQMEEKIRIAERLYVKGRTRVADNYSYEATMIYREIRRREQNAKRSS